MTGTFRSIQTGSRATLRPGTIRLNGSLSNSPTTLRTSSNTIRTALSKNGVISKLMAQSNQKVASLQTPIFFCFREFLSKEQILNKRIQLRFRFFYYFFLIFTGNLPFLKKKNQATFTRNRHRSGVR